MTDNGSFFPENDEFATLTNIEDLLRVTEGETKSSSFQNINRIKFTIALSPYAEYNFYRLKKNVELLKKLSPHIHDIIFTSRVSPFQNDAHAVVCDKETSNRHLHDMLYIQEKTGIPVSPVYNNVYTDNSYNSLKTFIKNFRPLYEAGIRSCTIPHTLWMKFGLLQKEFPELSIKTTVLRLCQTAQDFWNFASAGFDYINLDRRLMRDQNTLKAIKRAQEKYFEQYGRYVNTSILTNEGCRGDCAFWVEHYQHNCFNQDPHDENAYTMATVPQKFSCQPSRYQGSCNYFREVTLPLIKEDLNDVLEYIDIVKLPGRNGSDISLYEHVNTIIAFKLDPAPVVDRLSDTLLFNTMKDYMNNQISDENLIDMVNTWRQQTTQCRYQCWDCDICEKLKVLVHNINNVSKFIDQKSNTNHQSIPDLN